MAGPPTDITPSELWTKLHQRPRPSEVVEFPRRGIDTNIRIQVLTLVEQDEARVRAKDYCVKTLGVPANELDVSPGKELLGDASACEILSIACLDEKPIGGTEENAPRYRRVFNGAKQIKDVLSGDEVADLLAKYLMVQRRFGPTEASVTTDAETNEWIQRLGIGGKDYPLASCSWQALAELATSLGVRAYSLSQHLASLRSTSPDTSSALPESWGIGTFFSGTEPEPSAPNGGETSPPEPSQGALPLLSGDATLTSEDAADIVRALRNAT